ncbi:MAG: glycosyltransferase family 4 protein [Helicobacteraceae bacterium]|jgi:glycosyltransferase involved in cell wall biosynthesis|nr:glycosyltransferase family 4 protein [Helicobacteraceae bacterium]
MKILFALYVRHWTGIHTTMQALINDLHSKGHEVYFVSHTDAPKLNINIEQKRIRFGFYLNPIALIYFYHLCWSKKIDVVAANMDRDLSAVGPACKILKIPLVRLLGRDDDINPRKIKSKWINKLFVTHCHSVCQEIVDVILQKVSWFDIPCAVIYSGVAEVKYSEEQKQNLREKLSIKKDDIILGITARLAGEKRVDYLIEVLAEILLKNENVKLVIAGRGEDENKLKELAEKLDVKDKVIFAGFTSEPKLFAAIYDICYLVSASEGLPFGIVEYMSAGKPTIASDVGGISEVIEDGVNGFLINPRDKKALIDRTNSLLEDDNLRAKIGENAYKKFNEKFTEKIMCDRMEEFFKSIARKQ